jgi:hypothetical protein
LRVSHVVKGGLDFYLIVNEGEAAIDGELVFSGPGDFEVWDPWSGEITEAKVVRSEGDCAVISLHINRRDSLIICRDEARAGIAVRQPELSMVRSVAIAGQWVLEKPSGERKVVDDLISWTEDDDMQYFAGEAVYEIHFRLDKLVGIKRMILDLGVVGEIAQVYINSREVGIKMWAPFEFDISEFITTDDFKLKVVVTNSISNKIAQSKVKSGLLGPVKVKQFLAEE